MQNQPFLQPEFLQQLIRFIAAGAVATAVQYLVLWFCVEANWLPAHIASGIGYALGAVCNYYLNDFFTFKSNTGHLQSVKRFVIMVSLGWALTFSLMWILNEKLGWYYWFAQLLTTLLVLAWNFLASRCWVFKG